MAYGNPFASPLPPANSSPPSFQAAASQWSPPVSLKTSRPRFRRALPSALSPPRSSPVNSGSIISSEKRNFLTSQLYAASCAGDLQKITLLVSLGTPIDARTLVKDLYESFIPAKHGYLSPLAGAATHGQIDAALILISQGAHINPDIRDSSSAPLHQACRANDLRMTQLLLEAGADVNLQNIYNTTAIMYAARHGSLPLIQLLLAYSPDLSICSMVGMNVIYWAMLPERDNSACIIAMLLQAGADANTRMADESTPLHYAAQRGLEDVVEVLLRFGVDERFGDHDYKTPLDVALAAGSESCVSLLENTRRSRKQTICSWPAA